MDIPKRDVERWIHDEFPYLRDRSYTVKSLETDDYNCIAWAVGDTENWWWPDDDSYWPESAPREQTKEAFFQAFRTRRYELCDFNGDVEPEYDKIVLFVDDDDNPWHAAKQLPSGIWTSKLGRAWDIEHDLIQGVECNDYGRARYMMSRQTLSDKP